MSGGYTHLGRMSKTNGIKTIPTPWREIVLVCRKCSKKLDGGFGPDGDEKLGAVLKQSLRAAGRRREVRVIEAKCLGLCPKGAVTVLRGSQPGALLAVSAGTSPADLLGPASSVAPS
jgi:predicted metal-binding protein